MVPPGSEVAFKDYSGSLEDGSVRTTTQIMAAVSADAGSGRSRTERLCVDRTTTPGLSGSGVASVNDAVHPALVAACGPLPDRLKELQYELGEGPRVDAFGDNRPIRRFNDRRLLDIARDVLFRTTSHSSGGT